MSTPQGTPHRRRNWARRVAATLLVLVAAIVADYHLYPRLVRPHHPSANHGENGLWLRYTWYFGQKNDAEVRQLAADLCARQIRYAYFHVRLIDRNGMLVYHYPDQARRLVRTLHRLAPQVSVIAWVYAGNARAGGLVDLSNARQRANMVGEARWLTNTCGFDGVQWDYETCQDGEPGLPVLLRETRAALPAGALLGVAASPWLPWHRHGWGWSEGYFAQVARECDQIAVMCYDTGMHLPRAYTWLLGEECRRVLPAVAQANPRCRVLLGLPTYGRGVAAHNPHAENLRLALIGARDGLPSAGSTAAFAGVALFADYTTEADEWDTYVRLWLLTGGRQVGDQDAYGQHPVTIPRR